MPKGTGRPFSKDIRNLSKYLHDSVPEVAMGKEGMAKADREASKSVLRVDDAKTERRAKGMNDARTSINRERRVNTQVTPGPWNTKNKI
jgi:hypothetical protein